MVALAFIGSIGIPEIIIIMMIGLLLFGARLPEVGRSLGKGLMEFKKGLRGVQDQMSDLDRETDRRVDEELARKARLAAMAESPPVSESAPAKTADEPPPAA